MKKRWKSVIALGLSTIMCLSLAACGGIYYNKDLFEQYGVSVPKTLSELESACDTFLANGRQLHLRQTAKRRVITFMTRLAGSRSRQ